MTETTNPSETRPSPTSTAEDYLERIYSLIEEKGYARVSDIAEALQVSPSTVTRMVQKLDEQKLVEYERYRGLSLTREGERVGRSIRRRHKALEDFLHLLGIHDHDTVQQDVEGIEHHLSGRTLAGLTQLVEFFEANADLYERFKEFARKASKDPSSDPSGGNAETTGSVGTTRA